MLKKGQTIAHILFACQLGHDRLARQTALAFRANGYHDSYSSLFRCNRSLWRYPAFASHTLHPSKVMPRKPKKEPDQQARQQSIDRAKFVGATFPNIFPGGFTIRDEANALVACAFRNGPIEDLHAGKYSELLSDPSLSRITDDEMKALMINACRKMEELLQLKESDPEEYYRFIGSYNWRYCRQWER